MPHADLGRSKPSLRRAPGLALFAGASLLAACGGGALTVAPSYVAVHNTMTAMGLAQSGEINQGSLAEGGVARTTMQLAAGDCYTFVAFGDAGIADLDVLVFDDVSAEVAADHTTAAHAATQFCPSADGEYQVAVRVVRGGGSYVVSSWSGMARASSGGGARAGGDGTCASPIALTLGEPMTGSTSGAESRTEGTCIAGGSAPERVYTFTMEERAQLTIEMNSDYDGALYLFGSCGDPRTEIACNDDAGDTSHSRIETTLDAGTYFLMVDGFGDGSGQYEIVARVQPLQALAQVCSAATPLRPGQAVTGSTAGQPSYFTATCAGGARSPDRVYALDVPTRSRLRLRMQSTHDGALFVRRACDDPNSEVACNDDHQDTNHSMITTELDPGRYFVYADGFGAGQAGDYSMRADLASTTGGGAAADTCAAPGTLSPGDMDIDTFPAADDYAGSCGGQGAPDVVYRVDVTQRSRLQARVAQSEFTTAVYLQSACGGQEVACAAGGSGPPGAGGTELDVSVQPGTYFLVVDGASAGQFGGARLEVTLSDLQALERACTQAPLIRPGRTLTGDTSSSSDRFQATCAGQARSNDLVYRLRLRRRSRVQISSAQQYDGALYVRSDCTSIASELACNDDSTDTRHSALDFEADAGTYYVFVDGFSNSQQGSFTLDVQVTRP